MHDYLLSIFLGVVEGLTEFLPVSSTAHLRICEALLHIDLHDGFWKMYTIVIQLGAILALPVYFWHRIGQFVRTFPRSEEHTSELQSLTNLVCRLLLEKKKKLKLKHY